MHLSAVGEGGELLARLGFIGHVERERKAAKALVLLIPPSFPMRVLSPMRKVTCITLSPGIAASASFLSGTSLKCNSVKTCAPSALW